MIKRVLIPIADGSEDLEAVTLIDVLRRADLDVTVASAEERRMLTCARGTRITVRQQAAGGREFAAICAAPAVALHAYGVRRRGAASPGYPGT